MTRSAATFVAVLLVGPVAFGDDPPTVTPKPFIVHPAAAPKPALKYQLLPELTDVHDGNQAHLFMKAFAEQSNFYFSKDEEDKRQKYLDTPLDELPPDLKNYGGNVITRLHDAARAEQVDWQILRELKRDGVNTLLPDAQWMRRHAQVLRVRCRGEIKAGDFPAAIRTVQTTLALARSFNEHPTLIGQLVGCAIASIGLQSVEEMIQQPGCPNLYWALSDLPTPFIDLRKGLQGDRVMLDAEFRHFPRGGRTWTGDQEGAAFGHLPKMYYGLEPPPPGVNKAAEFATYVATLSNDAEFQKACTGWLRDCGYADNDIDGMTPAQRVLVGSVERVHLLNDETAKWLKRPYHEMPDAIQRGELDRKKAVDVSEVGMFGGIIGSRLKPKMAQTRVDSQIAQLRTVEAIRLHAADKNGKLPQKIADAGVPAPIDPFSGKEFQYHVEKDGTVAVFTLTPPLGMAKAAPYNLRWKVSLAVK